MSASAAGTPATPPSSSTPPSASPCPRYAARSLRSARAFRRRDGGRVFEACVRRFGFDWLVRGFLSVVMMSYMVGIHTIVALRTRGCAGVRGGNPAEQWVCVSLCTVSCAWRTGLFGCPSVNVLPGASSALRRPI